MNVCILMGSPRKEGNTAQLLRPFVQTLEEAGAQTETLWLYDLDIQPCTACRTCQRDWTIFGCRRRDDGQLLFDRLLAADLIVLATPIYSWYCTAPVKAALDRLVYAMDKYYGQRKGPSLLAGKAMAAVLTCGYRPERGADLFTEGMRRWCRHTAMTWRGSRAARPMGSGTAFMDGEKAAHAAAFAGELMARLTGASEEAAPARP